MKKTFSLFIVFICVFVLVGCDNNPPFNGYYGKAPEEIKIGNFGTIVGIAEDFKKNSESQNVTSGEQSSIEVAYRDFKASLAPDFYVTIPHAINSVLQDTDYNCHILFEDGNQKGYFIETRIKDPSLPDINSMYYNFVACNAEAFWRHPNDFGEALGTRRYNMRNHNFFYQKEAKSYGEVLTIIGTVEIEGNKYTYGAKYVYKNVNLNSAAIRNLKRNSNFPIKLGIKDDMIENIENYEKKTLPFFNIIYGLANDETKEYYGVSPFYNSGNEKYVIQFNTTSEEFEVSGIKCKMNYQQVKKILLKQGYEEIVNRRFQSKFVNDNVIITIDKDALMADSEAEIIIYEIEVSLAYTLVY